MNSPFLRGVGPKGKRTINFLNNIRTLVHDSGIPGYIDLAALGAALAAGSALGDIEVGERIVDQVAVIELAPEDNGDRNHSPFEETGNLGRAMTSYPLDRGFALRSFEARAAEARRLLRGPYSNTFQRVAVRGLPSVAGIVGTLAAAAAG